MYKPSSTYRIQFNQDFTFQSLRNIIPYLKKLGIDTIYASPIFESSPGSMHGYDTINPHKINPEIGTEAELYQLSADLKAAGIG
jgi:maltooligosyltrehalose synthase